ncbi:MAG TPA: hypothetical protein VHS59_03195, partial [Bacillota bacterium]|nr:hypothetical protein [Bacillota bacterium]
MGVQRYSPFTGFRQGILLAALLAGSVIGNYLSLPLLEGSNILWGSIGVLTVVQLYGRGWGSLAALVSSLSAYQLHLNFFYVLLALCEVAVVGQLMKKREENVLLFDGIFWLTLGIPMSFAYFYAFMASNLTTAMFKVLQLAVNGISNALIVSLFFIGLQWWRGTAHSAAAFGADRADFPFRKLFFTFTTAIVLGFATTMLYIENRVDQQLLQVKMSTWSKAANLAQDLASLLVVLCCIFVAAVIVS